MNNDNNRHRPMPTESTNCGCRCCAPRPRQIPDCVCKSWDHERLARTWYCPCSGGAND